MTGNINDQYDCSNSNNATLEYLAYCTEFIQQFFVAHDLKLRYHSETDGGSVTASDITTAIWAIQANKVDSNDDKETWGIGR